MAPAAGQFGSTARMRVLPTTHCEYVHPSAMTFHTCWRVAAMSRSTVSELSIAAGCMREFLSATSGAGDDQAICRRLHRVRQEPVRDSHSLGEQRRSEHLAV